MHATLIVLAAAVTIATVAYSVRRYRTQIKADVTTLDHALDNSAAMIETEAEAEAVASDVTDAAANVKAAP